MAGRILGDGYPSQHHRIVTVVTMIKRNTKRLTRDDWVAAARTTLVDRGIDGVKVDGLARKLRVTRGSFYWHFQHRRDLLDALLADWETRNGYEIGQVRGR